MTSDSTRGNVERTDSIVALPHKPQLDEAKTWRVSFSKSTWTSGASATFNRLPSSFRPQGSIRRTS